MKKETTPDIYGLIGYPIKHSLSPAMHNAAFKKLKMNALYMLFEKTREEFPAAVRQLKAMKIRGFNVTVPYKEEIIPYLDGLDEQARRIGAVNTVLNQKGRFIGYNTDAPGFIASLKEDLDFAPQGKNIFIIGAGGAARAIGFALAKEKAKIIVFCDCLAEKAKRLAKDIKRIFPNCLVSSVTSPIACQLSWAGTRPAPTIDLLVNASNCGMKPGDPLPIDPKILPAGIRIYDIIYNPAPTKLVKESGRKRIKAVNGLGMLLRQGTAAFEIWTNKKAPVELMRQALLKAINGKPY